MAPVLAVFFRTARYLTLLCPQPQDIIATLEATGKSYIISCYAELNIEWQVRSDPPKVTECLSCTLIGTLDLRHCTQGCIDPCMGADLKEIPKMQRAGFPAELKGFHHVRTSNEAVKGRLARVCLVR